MLGYFAVFGCFPLWFVHGSQEIYFERTGLNEVPPIGRIPLDTKMLSLDHNNISFVSSEELEGLNQLTELHLYNNTLTIFPNLSSVAETLQILDIAGNKLYNVPADHLDLLVSLEELYLRQNKLVSLPDVAGPSDTLKILTLHNNKFEEFPSLRKLGKSLRELKLWDNDIRQIRAADVPMVTNGHLETFRVHNNKLTTIPLICDYSVFYIGVAGNPLQCDGRMAWMLTEGLQRDGDCESPAQLKDRPVASLSYRDLGITTDMYEGVRRVETLALARPVGHYCRTMPITKVTVLSKGRCHMICNNTPGCLFYNTKVADSGDLVSCHYSDPLEGHIYSQPDNSSGWKIYVLQ